MLSPVIDKDKFFDNLIVMHAHANTEILTKKAIDAALKRNWLEAIETNLKILEKNPADINAKLRLGRAYMFTKAFPKATKLFKEVLKLDPINTVASKNLEIVKTNKVQSPKLLNSQIDQTSLIIEPGTTQDINIVISARGTKAQHIEAGEKLKYKLLKTRLDIFWNEKLLASVADKSILSKLNTLLNTDGERLWVTYKGGMDKNATIILKASRAIFRSQKQEVRPYIKKGTLDEPELELPVEEGE